jgi:uncharacterized LabA/DUF88 family protein
VKFGGAIRYLLDRFVYHRYMPLRRRRRNPPKQNFAFIDSQNLTQTVQRLGWKMDWRKFRQYLKDTYGVTRAYMFIGYVPEFEAMYEQLHDMGYLIVLKPTYDMTRPREEDLPESQKPDSKSDKEAEDKKPTKGNIDADLVLWAMKELPNYDKAVIVSGDGDFYGLVEYLSEKRKLLKLLAPSMQFSNLYNTHIEYVERLDTKRNLLQYHDRRKKPKNKPAPNKR